MSNFRESPFPFKRLSSKSCIAGLFTVFLFLSTNVFHPQALSQQQDEDEVVRVEADLVILNVTVTDKQGRYIHKLARADFKVLEDGRDQAINFFSVEETPFAAAILLDTSGSMGGRVSLARAAAIRFLDGLRADDVAAVYNFDSLVEQLQDYSHGRALP
nr:VWA domain-containing protein [Acidobacteriota bacterium]